MKLSLRAKTLLKLERLFPPLADAPAERGEHAAYEFAKAEGSYAKFVEELGGLENKTVLDFGCGWGGESAWLATQARKVVGCDINPDSLEDARRFKATSGLHNLEFAQCGEQSLPFPDQSFDAIFSTNVFEHVMHPLEILSEIRRVLKPGGSFVSTFGPLFYSPLGYHLPWATQVPWAHVLFGLKPVMEVRNLKRLPMSADTWQDTGLNMMTFAQFRRVVRQVDLYAVRLNRIPAKRQTLLAKLPGLGDYFTFGIDCHLVRPQTKTMATTVSQAA